MDRASDSGSEGWGFESLPAYQKYGEGKSLLHIFIRRGTRKISSQQSGGLLLAADLDGGNTSISAPFGAEMQTSSICGLRATALHNIPHITVLLGINSCQT